MLRIEVTCSTILRVEIDKRGSSPRPPPDVVLYKASVGRDLVAPRAER